MTAHTEKNTISGDKSTMEKTLAGKAALVTGGSRGIGRAITLRLSELGADVGFNYVNDKQSADELAALIEEKGGKVCSLQADVAEVEQIEHLFSNVRKAFGRLDILVNNAGIAVYRKIDEVTEQEFDRSFGINVKGLFFCCREAARHMENNGSIVNIGSSVTRVMMPTYGVYSATKGAVEQITKVLAKELGHRGIRVNTVSPGPVNTELFRQGKSEEQIDGLAAMAALGRIGEPEDIAELIGDLVGNGARWVTGQNILVNGGFTA